ncbi:MAG: hypothetical protein ABR884_02610 [Minisyncoccia bacterium]|jgi:hypothetical protein
MDQNLSKLTKVGNWIATLLLGNTRELIIRIDERLSGFIVEMTEFKVETKAEFKEIGSVLKGQGGTSRSAHGNVNLAIAGLTSFFWGIIL